MAQKRSFRVQGGFTFVELLIVAALGILLFLIFLPGWKRHREQVSASRDYIATELHHVERAKALFVANRHLPDGTTVALVDLIKAGYYQPSKMESLQDIVLIPGKVGEPADYRVCDTTAVGAHRTLGVGSQQ